MPAAIPRGREGSREFSFEPEVKPARKASVMDDMPPIVPAIDQEEPRTSERLIPLVYEELQKLAAHKLAQERPGTAYQASDLVHEAYLRLVLDDDARRWDSRGHFFAAAAEAMRRILVENTRRGRRLKRGGDLNRAALLDTHPAVDLSPEEAIAVDDALSHLAAENAEAAELVKLRYFAGLSVEEAARALGMSRATAYRCWSYARAWCRCGFLGEM